jgi:hypothetical protein
VRAHAVVYFAAALNGAYPQPDITLAELALLIRKYGMSMYNFLMEFLMRVSLFCALEPYYNDIGLRDTSPITSHIVVPVSFSLLTITLYSSVRTTLVYNGTEYFVPFMTL